MKKENIFFEEGLLIPIVMCIATLIAFNCVELAAASVTFTVTNTDDSGPGSLRQAIIDANDNPGKDKIVFNIPSPGPHTIQPESGLPWITDPVIINGSTQNEMSCNHWPPTLMIESCSAIPDLVPSLFLIAFLIYWFRNFLYRPISIFEFLP